MPYDRNSRSGNRDDRDFDYGRDYGSGRDYTYSSARDYDAAGSFDDERRGYGTRDYGHQRYAQRDRGYGQGQDYRSQDYRGQDYRGQDKRGQDYQGSRFGGGERGYGRGGEYGGYRNHERYGVRDEGSRGDGHRRFAGEDYGPGRSDYRGGGYGQDSRYREQQDHRGGGRSSQDYGRQPQGYDYEERGFMARAGDEVRSWFGDEEAERRREADSRYDERYYAERDNDYHSWRSGQIAALDRDYDEYRSENRSKFENEFGTWRTQRQGQRDLLNKVTEHMDVVGSDGTHVGTVDKVRGDRILLTKNDSDAGGRHHSIPSRWLQTVDTKVTLAKTADEAKKHWRDEEDAQALFGDRPDGRRDQTGQSNHTTQIGQAGQSNQTGQTNQAGQSGQAGQDGSHGLNKSFSGTY
ncbi:DUF2171 domain-containing protein [Sphingomonas carotinifaciens]|uniref:DUF2171 domain-containing protein n=1 Tax=Sphingomonas carotinifaciens TaxID=1166323 RepID=UPI0039A0FA4F